MYVLRTQTGYIRAWVLAMAFAVGLAAPLSAAGPGRPAPRPAQFDMLGGSASDRVIVKLTDAAQASLHPHGACVDRKRCVKRQLGDMSQPLSQQWQRWGAASVRPAYPFEFAHPDIAASVGLDRYYTVRVPKGTDTVAMADELRQCSGEIESAMTDVIGGAAQLIPNDGSFDQQWGMHNTGQNILGFDGQVDADIDAPEAWDIHTGNYKTVTIAIIDSGVFNHAEFAGRLLPGFNSNQPLLCSGGNNINQVCVDDTDCPGGGGDSDFPCDKINRDTSDNDGHGTHVAGIATAAGDNSAGVAGVTWGANILPVRVLSSQGFGSAQQASNGLIWAVDNGADVCNISLQYYINNSGSNVADILTLVDAAAYAKANDVLVVVAAGNGHCSVNSEFCSDSDPCPPLAGLCLNNVAYPGVIADVLTVSATHNEDLLNEGSNFGPEVDVAAPGEGVFSTHNNSGYIFRTGTSMASPHVAGLAALIMSYAPQLSADEVRVLIETTTDDLGPTGPDDFFGEGRINAWSALMVAPLPFGIQSSTPLDGAVDARIAILDDGVTPIGWRAIDLTFDGVASFFKAGDFTVSVLPSGVTPTIASVTGVAMVSTITLDDPIAVDAATRFLHNTSGTSRTISHRPGDVDADGSAGASDILALEAHLLGTASLAVWSTDIDRSGETNSLDIISLIGLQP